MEGGCTSKLDFPTVGTHIPRRFVGVSSGAVLLLGAVTPAKEASCTGPHPPAAQPLEKGFLRADGP